MLRSLDIILICGMVGAAAWTFKVKNDAQQAIDRIAVLERHIADENAEISLLRADWGLFTSPKRLQALVEKFSNDLKLGPTAAGQITNFDVLPPYRSERLSPRSPLLDGYAEVDRETKTGSVPLKGGNLIPEVNTGE